MKTYVVLLTLIGSFVFGESRHQTNDPPPPPGGQKVVNVTDPRVIKASFAGIESINLQNGLGEDVLREVIYKITNATEQVVNGELFRLTMEVGPSECFNTLMNIGKSATECPLLSPKLVHPCFTEVLSRNWTVPQHLTLNMSCQPLPNIEGTWLKKVHLFQF